MLKVVGVRGTLSAALLFVVAHNVDGFLSIPAYTHGSSIRISSSKVVQPMNVNSIVVSHLDP
jgi:hypothetical protein